MRDLWTSTKNWLRERMLSPGFDNYDPENPEPTYAYDDEEPRVERDELSWQEHAQRAIAPKTTKSTNISDKYVEMYGRNKSAAERFFDTMVITSPKNANESNVVTDALRDNKVALVNLTDVDKSQAQRVVDIIAGAAYALDGTLERITQTVFVVAPDGFQVTNEVKEKIAKGFSWFR